MVTNGSTYCPICREQALGTLTTTDTLLLFRCAKCLTEQGWLKQEANVKWIDAQGVEDSNSKKTDL